MIASLDPSAAPQSLRAHVGETLVLALPIIVARAAILMMFVVDTLMTGWAGATQLAYLGLGTAPQLVMTLVAIGALQSIVVLTAQAQGAGDATGTGKVFRAGLIHAVVLGLIVCFAAAFANGFFLATGQSADLAAGATVVTRQFAWGVPGMLAFVAVNLFLEATGRPRVGMLIMIGINILNVPLNGVFALGWGGLVEPMGAAGAVAASSGLRWLAFVVALAFLVADEKHRGDPRRLIVGTRVWLDEIVTLGGAVGAAIRKLGLPMGLAQGVESAAFASIVFIAGTLGTAPLAAHQVTMTLITLIYTGSLGLAGATAIRVGRAVGARRQHDVPSAGFVGIGLGALFALPCGLTLIAAPDLVAGLFTTEPAVLSLTRHTLVLAGTFTAIDCAMGVATGALRGVGDVWAPTLVQASAFWLAAVPIAWVLSGHFGLGPVGLLWGIFAGVVISLALLGPRFALVARKAAPAI